MRFSAIGSGSKGNALVVEFEQSWLLIDCGLPFKKLAEGVSSLGLSFSNLLAVFITHEHGDHIGGLAVLMKKVAPPVYMTRGTAFAAGIDPQYINIVSDGIEAAVQSFSILPVTVPHDAREPCQYVVSLKDTSLSLGVLTDLGMITPHVVKHFGVCDALVLEANHDLDMLRQGNYPPKLKSRVAGDWGHLNNQQAANFVTTIDRDKLQWLVLAHVSEQNNALENLNAALDPIFPDSERRLIASQDAGFPWLVLTSRLSDIEMEPKQIA